MGFADGDFNHFKRYWAYYYASRLDTLDPGWRYQPLMVVARALGLDNAPASLLAAVSSPAPALDPSGQHDERRDDRRKRSSRHGRRECRDRDGWGGWDDREAWDGRDDRRERSDVYNAGYDDGYGRRYRPRSRRPRRSRGWSSSSGEGGGGFAFARCFGLGLAGEVIDVDDGRLVRLCDSRGYPGCGLVTQDEWLRRYTQTVDMRRPGSGPVAALPGAYSAGKGDGRAGGARRLLALPSPPAPERLMPAASHCWRLFYPIGVSPWGPMSRSPGPNGGDSMGRSLTRMALMIAPLV